MKTTGRLFVLAALPILWGCGGAHLRTHPHDAAVGGGTVPVSLVLAADGQAAASRTITPGHIPQADWEDPAKYKLTLSGSSDLGGSIAIDGLRVSGGRGGFDLPAGAWDLALTATPTTGAAAPVLRGGTSVIVHRRPVSVTILLEPLDSTTGTVSVDFTLPQSVVKRLDPPSNNAKQVTVALHDEAGNEVTGTRQTFTANATDATSSFTYTAGGPAAAGRYELRMTAPYTVNNASTNNQNRVHTLGWSDTLYVEGNRQTTASVAIPEARAAMGVPDNPYRRDKATVNANPNQQSQNFITTTRFDPFGEALWLYGTYWDGSENIPNGNEVLVVDWDPVYNTDYYELELLVHPFTRRDSTPPTKGTKFSKVATDDAAWEALRTTNFTYNGQSRAPFLLRYSGGQSDPNYYRSKSWDINCLNGASVEAFTSCADKNLARTLFTGTRNGGYRVTGNDAFDTYGNYSYNTTIRGKVGLEGDCGVIGVLLPSYTPQMSVVFRLRGVNEFGTSDWVYWKGGKW